TIRYEVYQIVEADAVTRIDFNRNDQVDVFDVDELAVRLQSDAFNPLLDLNQDQANNGLDLLFAVNRIAKTSIGDVNLDGQFNSQDLVQVFTAGEYDDGLTGNSLWSEGDWNGDGDFDSSDFVTAFTEGNYTSASIVSVPEPANAMLLMIGVLLWRVRLGRRR
ncbi:MAG: hypothetical protein KDA87_24570, partial [Planctomycetales bacterium]|nr:hypothetical protein [Planctomycetales bacterium]